MWRAFVCGVAGIILGRPVQRQPAMLLLASSPAPPTLRSTPLRNARALPPLTPPQAGPLTRAQLPEEHAKGVCAASTPRRLGRAVKASCVAHSWLVLCAVLGRLFRLLRFPHPHLLQHTHLPHHHYHTHTLDTPCPHVDHSHISAFSPAGSPSSTSGAHCTRTQS